MKPDFSDALIIAGGGLLLAGAWLMAPALAMMVGGGLLLAAGVIRGRRL